MHKLSYSFLFNQTKMWKITNFEPISIEIFFKLC